MKTLIKFCSTQIFIFSLLTGMPLLAGSPADSLFDASTIPAHLLEDADAVVRYYEIDLRVDDRRRSHITIRRIVTVLNPQGRSQGELAVGYDKFRSIRTFRGELFDANGRRIKRLRRGDIQDYSSISGISLYDDSRVQYAELYHNSYPYTIYFEYEIRNNGYISYPNWFIQERRTAVENTTYTVRIPHGTELRYRNVGYDGEPVVTSERDFQVYTWYEHDVPAFEEELSGPHILDQVMSVRFAPGEFEIDGYRGDLSSWTEFGKWYHMLSEGRDNLPPSALQDVERIAANAGTEYDVVKSLFEYMQSRTRYVSIQLGIGGWQPFDATYVHERGYGDCKALTNYMMALLSAAGIESFPVLIYAGPRPRYLDDEFPVNQFNHVILSVPVDGDTIWLECTSQTIPFGHIGRNNENRKALLVTPEGGKLIHTHASSAHENQQHRNAIVNINMNGSANAEITERYTGLQQDRVRHGIVNRSTRDRLNWMKQNISLPSFNIDEVDYTGVEGRSYEVQLKYNVDVPRFANRMGTRLIFSANFLERRTNVPVASDNREHPIHFPYAYHDIDSISYTIPEGFTIEAKPDNVEIDTEFARYHARVDDSAEGRIVYYREIEIKNSVIPAEEYEAYREFFREVVRADRAQIVFVRR